MPGPLAISAISASLTFSLTPLRLSNKNGELNSLIKSFQYCGWLANACPAFKTLLSVKLIKLIADIVWSTADLVLKNIIAPTELVNQSVNLPVIVSVPKDLFLPVSIRFNMFSNATLYGLPKAASSLFKFGSENIWSTFCCQTSKYLALLVVFNPLIKSVSIVPATQPSSGAAYSSVLFIAINSAAKLFKLASFSTKSIKSFLSCSDIPGTSIPCWSHI